jgi:hypothetical protein
MADETKTEAEEIMLSKHDFYFETPLYELVDTKILEEKPFSGDVDAYSAKNSTDTTYSISMDAIDTWTEWDGSSHVTVGFYLVTLTCKRKNNDILRFVVFFNKVKSVAMKVGQYPSLADLQFAELGKKYDKVLPDEDLKNLKKAIGLVSHGAGAGSFVYLRRIFENLIFETYKKNQASLSITEAEFRTKRMLDKIELIKDFLPSQLLEMKGVYTILGKGVHELTEEECLQYFSPIKLSIELILDQKIEESKKKEKDLMVKQQLQKIQSEIAKQKE